LVLQATDVTENSNPQAVGSAVTVDWTPGDKSISVRNVAGVAADRKYLLRIVVL
jgi:hypothetical protein